MSSLKNNKGFTLVEVIVVLVILSIMSALLVPSLTGYISKANTKAAEAEARMVAVAVQTVLSEAYASKQVAAFKAEFPQGTGSVSLSSGASGYKGDVYSLCETGGAITSINYDGNKLIGLSWSSTTGHTAVWGTLS